MAKENLCRAHHGSQWRPQRPRRSRCLDAKSSSIGVSPAKPLSPKSLNFPVAPQTEKLTRKRSPTRKSSFRNGSKLPKNLGAPSPPIPGFFGAIAAHTLARHQSRRMGSYLAEEGGDG